MRADVHPASTAPFERERIHERYGVLVAVDGEVAVVEVDHCDARAHAIPRSPAIIERRDRLGGLIHEYTHRRMNRLCAPHTPSSSLSGTIIVALAKR